jgi:hypothetical protein
MLNPKKNLERTINENLSGSKTVMQRILIDEHVFNKGLSFDKKSSQPPQFW